MRVGILGVGRLGASHAASLRALGEVGELRVYDADPARAANVARDVEAVAVPSEDAAIGGSDAVVIVTPTPTHVPLIRRCVESGIPTFCEKPIAIGIPETRKIVELVATKGGRVQIGFQRRFDAGYRAARERIAAGALGPVFSFSMTSCDRLPPPDEYVRTSGGQFKDQFIHDFDITRWLFASEVEEVSAMGSTLGFPQYEPLGDVGTSAVVLRLASGTLGVLTAARWNEAGYDIHVEVHGAKETLAIGIDPRTPWRSVEADAPPLGGPAYPSFFVRFGDAYRAELRHFLAFARGEAENPCTVADALEAIRIAEACGRSWREGRPVRLAEVA